MDFDIDCVRELFRTMQGIILQDDSFIPCRRPSASATRCLSGASDEIYWHPQTLNMWIVTDNLRKGAAANAVQIAEVIVAKN